MTTQSTHPYSRLPKQTAGWDRIGDDDDEIYIQSDDHRLSSWATTSKLPPPPPPPSHHMDYSDHERSSSQQPRKRKRIAAPHQSTSRVNKPNDIPSTSQYPSSFLDTRRPGPQRSNAPDASRQPERPAPTKSWKYDAEGCANCRIHQSTCWWKKNRLVTNLHGVESWEEEKLCNTCSIHWNKNGYHRTVRSKPNKRSDCVQLSQPDTFTHPSSQPSNSLARIPSTSRGSTVGLSSPSVSLAKLPSAPPTLVPRRRARSPSQLTRAAEREARILKRTLPRKTGPTRLDVPDRHDPTQKSSNSAATIFHPPAKASSTKQHEDLSSRKSNTHLGGYEVTKQMLDNLLAQSLPPVNLNTSAAPSEADLFSEFIFDEPTEQSHQPLSSLNFSEAFEPTRPPLSDHPVSSSFAPRSSPPRTPPSKRAAPAKSYDPRHHASKTAPSPTASPSCDLDYLLSPSFLNASPNSLLKKLIPSGSASDEMNIKTVAPGSAASLPVSDLFAKSDKIFLSSVAGQQNSDTLLPPSPEPSKTASKGNKWRGSAKNISTTFSWDLHLTPSSSNSNKSSIFPGSELLSLNTNKSEDRISPTMKKLLDLEGRVDESETHPPSPTELVTRKLPPKTPRKTKKPIVIEDNPTCASVALAQQLRSKSTYPNKPRFSEKSSTMGSIRNETENRVGSIGKFRSPRPSKNLMARTIWSRRPLSSGPFSSEISHDHEQGHFQNQLRSSPAQSEHKSDRMACSGSSGLLNVPDTRRTGMSSVMRHGLQFNFPIDANPTSERTGADRSSPPVLPPPSDCSEGIASHSPGLFSDEDDELPEETEETENINKKLQRRQVSGTSTSLLSIPGMHASGSESMRKLMIKSDLSTPSRAQNEERGIGGGSGGGLALKDITRSLNEPEGPHQLHQNQSLTEQASTKRNEGHLQGLSPEIVSAFREAIKAGWTPEDLARALKTFEAPGSRQTGENGIEKDG
ncbi:uncharacterized protein MELLADRAFT_118441 [Melampsora larici-populina 98AG31]|uniref:GATA-type domain-containing protein n=1 Tax=Melampsora larici-populina (strain 98AG31 / pathotype 3-4-7) TaxID=747676 RepID=F4S991_MELLP|nr:uncharacterized protein MELLADRAFT_118441 [Melampsora larici-populina 98AG31]EGF98805.1 hypothetical protein MELLADRAFT_118441 [Melampsora larici-populina 98AG31]